MNPIPSCFANPAYVTNGKYNTCLTYFVCRETVIFLLFIYCLILCEIFCLLFNFVLNFQDLKERLEHMYVVNLLLYVRRQQTSKTHRTYYVELEVEKVNMSVCLCVL